MPGIDQPVETAAPPFEPDEYGYCYRHRREFDQAMAGAAAHLIESRLLFGRWTGTLLWFICLLFLCLGVWFFFANPRLMTTRWIAFLVPNVYACWLSTRSRRLGRKIAAKRLCLRCGYSLLGAPTDDEGWGQCSECSTRFNIAYYRRPEAGYRRNPDTYVPALPIDQLVHPYDIARMRNNADEEPAQIEEEC